MSPVQRTAGANSIHRSAIVGSGAGELELATMLGERLGKRSLTAMRLGLAKGPVQYEDIIYFQS